jgi:predicted alpha/beta-fold hydrolase
MRAFDKVAVAAELASRDFAPSWWLAGRHRQTVWSPLLRRQRPPTARRERWRTPDDDRLSVWIREAGPDRPWALLLHGLEGSARSNYVVGMRRGLAAMGWNVAALEFRSCDGEINAAPRLYHSGETTDLDFVVGELIHRFAARRLYLAGVSLGGNVLAKWLGERSEQVPAEVCGAAAISPPFDLTVSGPVIDQALGGLYVRRFLRTLIPKALAKAEQFPALLDADRIRASRSFEDFDTWATAALHGFDDAWDYWRRVSSGAFLPAVRVPLLLVAAEDDPFNPASTLPVDRCRRSPWLLDRFVPAGGHVGFVSGPPWRTRHWAEEQALRFFELVDLYAEG